MPDTTKFNPADFGATEINTSSFNPASFGATPINPEDQFNQSQVGLAHSQGILDNLSGIGKSFGIGPLGESIARGIYDITKSPQDLPTSEAFGKPAPTVGQVAGSALQTGALATPFSSLGALGKIPRIGKYLATTAGKLGLLGTTSGVGKALEERGTPSQVIESGVLGAGIGVATAGLGGAAQGIGKYILGTSPKTGGLPARLIGNIFKTSTDEELRTAYAIVHGELPPPTLRQIALRENMMGDNQTMLVHSIGKLENFENQLQDAAKVAGNVRITNKNGLLDALNTVSNNIKENAFGTRPDALQEAERLTNVLKNPTDEIPADEALNLKRFIDGQRANSSFQFGGNLSAKQEGLKTLASGVRGAVYDQIPQAKELLNSERDYIRMRDAILDDAARRGNKQILGLADAFLVGGGAMIPHGLGVSLGTETAMRAFQEPGVITRVARALNLGGAYAQKLPNLGIGRTAEKVVATQIPRFNVSPSEQK